MLRAKSTHPRTIARNRQRHALSPLGAELERARSARSHMRRYRVNALQKTAQYLAASLETKESMIGEVEAYVEELYQERSSRAYIKFADPPGESPTESESSSSSSSSSSSTEGSTPAAVGGAVVPVKVYVSRGVQTGSPEHVDAPEAVQENVQLKPGCEADGNCIDDIYDFHASDDGDDIEDDDDSESAGDSSEDDGKEDMESAGWETRGGGSDRLVSEEESLLDRLTREAEDRERERIRRVHLKRLIQNL